MNPNLVNEVTSKLNIREDQAQGAIGLVLKLAQEKLSKDKFTKLARAIPNAEGMMAKAPEMSVMAGAIAGAAINMGGKATGMANFAALADSFAKLGIDKNKVAQFTPMIMTYVEQAAGKDVANQLAGLLK